METAPLRCHIVLTLVFSVLACLVDINLYHIVLVLGFTFLFSKWTLTNSATNCYLSSTGKNVYSILYYLDFLIWETSPYWSGYVPFLRNVLPANPSTHLLSKILLLVAFSLLQMIPEGPAPEKPLSAEVKARWRTNLEVKLRVTRILYRPVDRTDG